MAFSGTELTNIGYAALDWYLNRPDVQHQTIQNRPLLSKMVNGAQSFPGGKGNIVLSIQGAYGAGGTNDGLAGYTHNDTVNFFTPANLKQATYAWREMHIGLTVTHTELKMDGISVTDANGESTSKHSERDKTVIVSLFDNKMFDFKERYERSLNTLLWGDGTADAKALAGIRAILVPNPTTGTVGGINRATAGNEYWRNRARTAAHAAAGGSGAVTSSATNGGALLQVLQQEYRQLIRYGGKPDVFFAGSDFIGAMEVEMRANGLYSQSGFSGAQDGAMGAMKFMGVNIVYDPTLDDLGLTKRAYWFDSRHIFLMKMENEWNKKTIPARPENQFAMYVSVTSTGQVVAKQCNSGLVIDIA